MSLVGTRPPTVDEWDKYELHHRARLATKPGLTGMWQVSGRSNITDFEEVVKLDKQYELCTGCGVCADICPQKAIKMTSSKRGFLYPAVDDNICIHCNRCIKQCPVKHDNVAETSYEELVEIMAKHDRTLAKKEAAMKNA